jgi:hypothetical protein
VKRDELLQALILAVLAGGIGGGMGLLIRLGFQSQDVFSFSGALVGAAAAVAGAAWVAERSATAAKREERELLHAECSVLQADTKRASAIWASMDPTDWTPEWRTALNRLDDTARETLAILQQAIATARALDFRQRAKIIKAEGGVRYFDGFYSDIMGDYVEDPNDERTWPATLGYMDECLTEVLAVLR